MQLIKEELFSLQDLKYRDFHSALMPTIDKETVIGVRTPRLRNLAKKLGGTNEAQEFLKELPHKYYEENNLHSFLISEIKDFESCLLAVENFLPYIDNWATCDGLRPKVFKKHPEKLLPEIKKWLKSDKPYVIRFGIEALMVWFLDENFQDAFPEMISQIKSEEYYVNMMIAWYFATALSKRWDSIFPYIENKKLPLWVHNKTIQKGIESYRISSEQKEKLRAQRIK